MVTTRVISSGELYCCLLPQCEALHAALAFWWNTTAKCVNAVELSKEFRELTKNGKNKAEDPGLWDEFYGNDVAYRLASCGSSKCQHHNGPFQKSCCSFISARPKRYCLEKIFFRNEIRWWTIQARMAVVFSYTRICLLFCLWTFCNKRVNAFFYKCKIQWMAEHCCNRQPWEKCNSPRRRVDIRPRLDTTNRQTNWRRI